MTRGLAATTLIAVMLGGCAGATTDFVSDGPSLRPAQDGLDVVGSGGRQIGFGREAAGALASAVKVAGGSAVPVTCGAGPSAHRVGPVTMVFTGGAFTGWATAGTPCA